jgi:DNA end-binding protein Ku
LQAIWKGSLGFGLVTIPIRLYAAVEEGSGGVSFHLLHAKDHGRIRFQRTCEKDGEIVAWKDVVKGVEVEDETVVVTPEELEAIEAAVTRRIEIEGFCGADEIDPIYFETPYYLEPEPGGERPYALLRDALAERGAAGIAKVALRSRAYLAAVKPRAKALVLDLLRYEDEVRDPSKLDLPEPSAAKGREHELALTLIDSLAMKFEPERYHDEYREAVEKLVQSKLEGKARLPRARKEPGKVVDLVEALKASLERTRPEKPARKRKAA